MIDAYERLLAARNFTADAAQRAAAERLQRLYYDLLSFKVGRRSALRRLFAAPEVPRGVYFWGGVGRGKSFLMDCFFDAVPYRRKRRIHFHAFMHSVHRQLNELKGESDPLLKVAERLASEVRLLCFDEFHVSDIADAMILGRLLEALFARGVVFVMTSNYPPDRALSERSATRELPADDCPDQVAARRAGDRRRHRLSLADARAGRDLSLPGGCRSRAQNGRVLQRHGRRRGRCRAAASRSSGARFRRSVAVTASSGSTSRRCVVGRVRRTTTWNWRAAITRCCSRRFPGCRRACRPRRGAFTWLVDIFYDHKVKLIATADCGPDGLYTQGTQASEFFRTASRLTEMRSREYLGLPHLS
jgi:cell division protein ZapE